MPGVLTAGGREGGKTGGDGAEVEEGGGGGDGDGAGKVCEVTGGGGEYVTHLSQCYPWCLCCMTGDEQNERESESESGCCSSLLVKYSVLLGELRHGTARKGLVIKCNSVKVRKGRVLNCHNPTRPNTCWIDHIVHLIE